MLTTLYSDVYINLAGPLLNDIFPGLRYTRECPTLSDRDWLACGINRTLNNAESGRGFLQDYAGKVADLPDCCPELTTFFTALRSQRRLNLATEADAALAARLMCDPSLQRENRLQIFRSLDDFDIYAGDGHFHAAAAHDPRADDDKKYAVSHLYTLNLRSHALGQLCVADQDNRKKEHEMRALKRQAIEALRQGARAGRKVLYIWDKAGIDFVQWAQWKRSGIYFISLAKDNMVLIVTGNRKFDRDNPVNFGVLKDELVATSSAGILVRRVTYKDPATQEIFEVITSEMSIEPGLIVQLYRMRWDIEKVFDVIKNKLHEKKAWATTAIAKSMQAKFICMTHNLMTLLEARMMHDESLRVDLGPEIEQLQAEFENADAAKTKKTKATKPDADADADADAKPESPVVKSEPESKPVADSSGEVRPRRIQGKDGIRNMVEDKRRRQRIIETAKQTLAAGHGQLPFGQRLVQRITQRSVKFVRWLRSFLFSRASWHDACTDIARRYLIW